MKKICFVALLFFFAKNVSAQSPCLDAIVTVQGDTIVGMLVSKTDTSYAIDNYNLILAFHKDLVQEYIPCFKEATRSDLARLKNLDYLTEKDLLINTPGYYLRKASRSFYLGLSMDLVGGITMGIALANSNPNKTTQKWATFAAGTTIFAGGIFFLLRSFYYVDKAGKILDLERSSIYLEPTKDGRIELRWNF
ncbi:MAG: hypothetical protein LBH82_06935 [Bacteroidales bacterium]|jgi:hypothetical protein|nr:hypothetical protein [Bacteroidales bacterium]